MMRMLGSSRGNIRMVTLAALAVLASLATAAGQQTDSGKGRGIVFGQEPPAGTGFGHEPGKIDSPQQIRKMDPGFLVRADVNRGLRSYRDGDSLSITVASEADAYIYVLYRQADGQVFQVFPNSQQPDNRVKAREAVQIPSADDTFRWVVGAPFGKESIKVLASKEPLTELSDPAMRVKFFNPVASKALKGIQLELGKPAVAWAEDNVEMTTYARGDTQQPSGAQRFGLFIGMGQYGHIYRTQMQDDGRMVKVHQSGHRDARMLAGVLEEVGQLSKTRLLTNEEATRNNVEEAMTQWLPSISKPGDTVLIFFSGTAMPLRQAAGVESNENILPLYDFVTANLVKNMREQRASGKLSTADARQLEYAEQLASRAGGSDQGTLTIVRHWAISDAVFAHWLQALAGRQVLVVLDSPYASAFAPRNASSNAMNGAVSRLGALGQQDIALLGACGGQLSDVYRNPQGLSLMTELLIDSLRASSGTLSIDEAHTLIAARMESRLAKINQALESVGKETLNYKPYLVNHCKTPALLKP